MTMLTRRLVLGGAGAAGITACTTSSPGVGQNSRAQLNPDWVVSEAEAIAWHEVKDENGPTLTGNASWRQFMTFLEAKLREYGCVDIHRSSWSFTRLETSLWPDDSSWSLTSNDRAVPLCNFGANCGLTGPEGVTAPLVMWDPDDPPDVAGKIVVFRPQPREALRTIFATADYEYATPYESWPREGAPAPQGEDATGSISPAVWDEMTATSDFVRDIADAEPAGVIFAMNLNRGATEGLYTFRVPEHYGFPSVYVDRLNGDAVIADARVNAIATLRVEGAHVDAEAYQLIAYLPGRDYGSEHDEQIQLRTHTDGPSISQDNGAFGLLGLVKYYSNIPQSERPRSLFVELDCRHFMPGAERSWAHEDYFEKHPHARDNVVALIAMEHLGQIEYVEDGDDIAPSGRSHATWFYASGDQVMIDAAHQAAIDHQVRSAIIRSPGREGANGGSQGLWYGMSRQGALLQLPTYGVQGDLGAYWAFSGGLNRFDARSFTRQVAAFAQLTGFLMSADLSTLNVPSIEHVTPQGAD